MSTYTERCDTCGGTGNKFRQMSLDDGHWENCVRCHGTGRVVVQRPVRKKAPKAPPGKPSKASAGQQPKKATGKTGDKADNFAVVMGLLAGSGVVYLCQVYSVVMEWWVWLIAFLLPCAIVYQLVATHRGFRNFLQWSIAVGVLITIYVISQSS